MQTLLKDVAHLEEDELAELAERYESLASFMAKSSEQIKKKHLENLSTVFGGMPDELRRQIDEALHRPPSS